MTATTATVGSNIVDGDETAAADANETTSILVGGSRSNVDIEDDEGQQKQKQKRNYHVHLRWLLLTVVVVMMLIGNNAWKKSSPSSSDSQLLPSSIAVIMDTTTIPSTSYSSLSSSLSSTTTYNHDYDPDPIVGPSFDCMLPWEIMSCVCASDSSCRSNDCSCDEGMACCDAAHNYACHVSCNSGSCGNVAIRANTQDDCDVISKNLGCHDCKTRQQSKEILEPYPNKVNAGYNYVTLCPYSVVELTEC